MPNQNNRSIRELSTTNKCHYADDTCACTISICVSYYSLQVFKQVAGHNTQALDLSEQAHQILTWIATDFWWHIVDLCPTHTCTGGTSVCVCSVLHFILEVMEKKKWRNCSCACIWIQVILCVSVSKYTCGTCTHSCCIEEYPKPGETSQRAHSCSHINYICSHCEI